MASVRTFAIDTICPPEISEPKPIGIFRSNNLRIGAMPLDKFTFEYGQ